MNEIKLSVNVNVDFSENTKLFIKELLSGNTAAIVAEAPRPSIKPTESVEPTKPKPEQVKPTVQTKPEQVKPTAQTKPVSEESNATIDDVRKALTLKVNEHRSEIKDKLNELGAPSVTKLDPSKYSEMYNFLIAL